MQKVDIVNITKEIEDSIDPKLIKKSMKIIAGKAAGICYMPDDYLSEGIQDEEKAIKRADGVAKSGHYSVYEHGHISFIIHTSKMMAMILNSMGLYSTSEKSARYTSMIPETKIEVDMYKKWSDKFYNLIKAYSGDLLTSREIEKLSMENARYMISVFTPTVMEYTLPYNRVLLMIGWLRDLSNTINSVTTLANKSTMFSKRITNPYNKYPYFYNRIASEALELADLLAIKVDGNIPDLEDHKSIGIEFIRTIGYIEKNNIETKKMSNLGASFIEDSFKDSYDKKEYYGDMYISKYKASFAEVAQAERHRTLHYNIDLPSILTVYVPKIIRGSRLEEEWIGDYNILINNNIIPQGTLLDVTESGRFEDFVLKCKERLCARAQLEITEVTVDQVKKFAMNSRNNMCTLNKKLVQRMIRGTHDLDYNNLDSIIVETRCRFCDYTCKEPCKLVNSRSNYFRNF